MDYAKGIEPITALRTRAAELIRGVRESGRPLIVTQNGKPTCVLQDVETFQRQRNQLLMLKLLAQGERQYQRGEVLSHAEVDALINERLEAPDAED